MAPFEWNAQSERAAQLVADGDLSNEKIAAEVGVGRTTLYRWSNHKDFAERVESILEDYRKAVRRRGLAILERRVNALNDRWDRMQRVIEQRAVDPDLAAVPGGPTGLIVRDLKGIGKGGDFQVVEVYSVDTGLLRELREHEKQAAQELGQWTERQHVETRDLSAAEEFDRRMAELAARAGAAGLPGGAEPGGQGAAQLSLGVVGEAQPEGTA